MNTPAEPIQQALRDAITFSLHNPDHALSWDHEDGAAILRNTIAAARWIITTFGDDSHATIAAHIAAAEQAIEAADDAALRCIAQQFLHEAKGRAENARNMKFRPHRGSLSAAMAEAVTVTGYAGLIDHLRKIHPSYAPPFDPTTISIKPYGGADPRIGWPDVHMVLDRNIPIGFIDGQPMDENNRS